MSEHLGDTASRVAEELRQHHLAQIQSGTRELEEDGRKLTPEDARAAMFSRFEEFRWRSSDALAVEQIRAAVNAMFAQEFAASLGVLDSLYEAVRIPQANPQTGMVMLDQHGRMVWALGPDGQPIEDWNRLTGQDVEAALYKLQRLSFAVTRQVNDLQTEAMFAKHIYEDNWHDAYSEVVDGTIKDREARASRAARQDKYFAFFKFALWNASNDFKREIDNFRRLLEKTLNWNVWNNPNAGR